MLKTIKKYGVGLSLIASLGCAGVVSAETTMVVGTWLPPTSVQNSVVWPTWAKWVEEATEGRVKVKIEYDVGHPKSYFQLVEDGVIDAGFSYHGYVPGRFRLPMVAEQPGMGVGAEAASVALWRVQQKYFNRADEFSGLEVVGMFTHGPGQLMTTIPIERIEDIKDKKIRIGGGVQADIAKRLSAVPVSAPATKLYEMMQQGVVDGTLLPAGQQKAQRLAEVTKYLTTIPGGMYMGTFSIFINPEFLDDLDPKDREAIISVSGERLSALAGKAWEETDHEGLEFAREQGVTIVEYGKNAEFSQDFLKLSEGMDKAWIDSVSDLNVDAAAALAELRKVAREYEDLKER
ncbi:TRAP transporter substrate-binding protein [Marinobacterium weihaiense]|uniref:TRAP transporter substrate-binding protein n=1 Tax=Marinobacterium weihaiense TaxID=2851016 RepID=A0ABS6MF38_9GAMM|nr:TRAP transporter substrate-binding protein [Marinobacterium weihaiense]MBV0934925.1 TRAP transporter substrate-binding protein [Marinobacterium weihaiense]